MKKRRLNFESGRRIMRSITQDEWDDADNVLDELVITDEGEAAIKYHMDASEFVGPYDEVPVIQRKGRKVRDPQTSQEWQDAVDSAEAHLRLYSARLYGLVEHGPQVNVERCEEILARGRQQGIHPSPDCATRLIEELMAARGPKS